MDAALVEAVRESQEPEAFEVFEENAETVGMFLRLQSQWVPSAGGLVGLNYQSAEFLFRIHDVKDQRATLDDLQVMEFAALRILNAKD